MRKTIPSTDCISCDKKLMYSSHQHIARANQVSTAVLQVDTVGKTEVFHRSQNIKADIKWPVTLHLPHGPIRSETKNLGPYGAFVSRDQPAKPGQILTITIEPPTRSPLKVIAEVDWTGKVLQIGMGMRFIVISHEDRQFLSEVVSNQLKAEDIHSIEYEED